MSPKKIGQISGIQHLDQPDIPCKINTGGTGIWCILSLAAREKMLLAMATLQAILGYRYQENVMNLQQKATK